MLYFCHAFEHTAIGEANVTPGLFRFKNPNFSPSEKKRCFPSRITRASSALNLPIAPTFPKSRFRRISAYTSGLSRGLLQLFRHWFPRFVV